MTSREQPIIFTSLAREQGITGVHTHVRQLPEFLARTDQEVMHVTPHSWARRSVARDLVLVVLFGARPALEHLRETAHVWWYRAGHGWLLRRALRRQLADLGPCVIYAQCPPSARAALHARTGPDQRVVLAVHFRISKSDEWADKGFISRTGRTYRSIRELERRTVPAVDGLVFVSAWGRAALHEWMPEATGVPGVVIPNYVRASSQSPDETVAARGDLVTVANLEAIKNHRYLLQVLGSPGRGAFDTRSTCSEKEPSATPWRRSPPSSGSRRRCACSVSVGTRIRNWPRYRVHVRASYSDSFPLAIVEAMAAGLPVVSSDTGGIPELIRDPEHGRFWPIDDPERGAPILIDLLESDQELERAGTAAPEVPCRVRRRRGGAASRVVPAVRGVPSCVGRAGDGRRRTWT